MSNNITRGKTTLLFCILIALFIVFDVFFWKSKIEGTNTPYNIIILSVDTLRPDHMGVYGYDKNTTPNIEAWAKNATIFTDVHTVVPVTYPSFSTLMTGISPYTTGIYNNGTTKVTQDGKRIVLSNKGNPKLPANITTFAQVLHNNGYTTTAFVGNAVLHPEFTGLDRGFDKYNTIYYQNERKIDSDTEVAQKALAWLQDHENTSQPFFLWMHLLGSHAPYTPSAEFACKFNQAYCSEIAQKGLVALEKERNSFQECSLSGVQKEQSRVGLFETLYDGEIGYSDSLVGTMLDEIKRAGLDKHTIVVFYGDHGEGFDHDYYFNHGQVLYESAVHIPLIIAAPDAKNDIHTISAPLSNTQIFPTLLDLLHIKVNNRQIYSPSFSSIFDSQANKEENTTMQDLYFMNAYSTSFAILENNYKYIYTEPEATCFKTQDELYDLSKDPQELHNIAKEKPQLVATLRQKLLAHAQEHGFIKQGESSKQQAQQSQNDSNKQQLLQQMRQLGY